MLRQDFGSLEEQTQEPQCAMQQVVFRLGASSIVQATTKRNEQSTRSLLKTSKGAVARGLSYHSRQAFQFLSY